ASCSSLPTAPAAMPLPTTTSSTCATSLACAVSSIASAARPPPRPTRRRSRRRRRSGRSGRPRRSNSAVFPPLVRRFAAAKVAALMIPSRGGTQPMALSSMTGFARSHGVCGSYAWAWELKSVNAKGLDVRLRLPPGWDAVELPVRSRAAEVLARGSVHGALSVERQGIAPIVRVNEPVLNAVVATLKDLSGKVDAEPPRLDGILTLKGVSEVIDDDEKEEERRAAEQAVTAGFHQAVGELAAMRRREGVALGQVLTQRLREIGALTARAEAAPGRKPEAIKAR